MPSLANKALLCQLEVFVADNAVRRGVLLTTTNNQSTTNAILDDSRTVAPSASVTLTPLATNGMTILRATGGPLSVTVKFGLPANAGALTAVTFTVSNVLVLSTQVATLSVTNPGTTDVQMRFIQT